VTSRFDQLSASQRELLQQWLPGAEVTADHSWGLVGSTVLELSHAGSRYIVKAGDAKDHHLRSEIRAHREWLMPWTSIGRAPRLVHANENAKILVTSYLPGQLVHGTHHERSPDIYRQAGELLARFHGQLVVKDNEFEARARQRTLEFLDKPHRIDRDTAERLRRLVRSWPTPPSAVVPTHGDWQPRNWLVDGGVVSSVDFGRAELRPALTDLFPLAQQQFTREPATEKAFLEGHGHDPRESDAWQHNQIRAAIGTTVWAFQAGYLPLEQQGHQMIAEVLAGL
jgi:aminoglycoside phosphotransferase (APT) family kinase protein